MKQNQPKTIIIFYTDRTNPSLSQGSIEVVVHDQGGAADMKQK